MLENRQRSHTGSSAAAPVRLQLGALPCGVALIFFKESEGRQLKRKPKILERDVAGDVAGKRVPNKVADGSEEKLRAGRKFQIVELNGAASEATSIYDFRNSLFMAYRTLFGQWLSRTYPPLFQAEGNRSAQQRAFLIENLQRI